MDFDPNLANLQYYFCCVTIAFDYGDPPATHFQRNPPGRGRLAVFPRCSLDPYDSDIITEALPATTTMVVTLKTLAIITNVVTKMVTATSRIAPRSTCIFDQMWLAIGVNYSREGKSERNPFRL
jgi:hypothetical protein